MNHRFRSRLLLWLSSLKNRTIKVRVFMIWRVGIQGLVIWLGFTELVMCPGFYYGSVRAHHLGYSLDYCKLPRSNRLYQVSLHLMWPLWWVTTQKMKFSIKGFFSKSEQIHRKLHLMENYIFLCSEWVKGQPPRAVAATAF